MTQLLEPTNWRDLPPIPEDWQVAVPNPISQTALKQHDRCDRSLYLYLKHKGGAGSHPLNRGSLVHLAIARLTNELWQADAGVAAMDEGARRRAAKLAVDSHELKAMLAEQGGQTFSPEDAKDVLLEVMAENPHLQVSAQERDAARGMLYNFATSTQIDPKQIVAVEQMLRLELGEWTIRGKVDRVLDLGGGTIEVVDYKTSWAMPTRDEFQPATFNTEGEPVGWSGDYQTQIYALMIAFGVFEDGMPIGEGYQRFRLAQQFPRHVRDGRMAEREAWVSRQQLTDLRFDVELQLRRLSEVNIAQRKWQATPGTHCQECPAAHECPLPRHLRPESQLADATPEELEDAAANWKFVSEGARSLKARIKARAKTLGLDLVRLGRDQALVFQHKPTKRLKTSQAEVDEAIDRAARLGEPFEWTDHYSYGDGTEFNLVKVDRRQNGDSSDGT